MLDSLGRWVSPRLVSTSSEVVRAGSAFGQSSPAACGAGSPLPGVWAGSTAPLRKDPLNEEGPQRGIHLFGQPSLLQPRVVTLALRAAEVVRAQPLVAER